MYNFQAILIIVILCSNYGQSQNFYPPVNGMNQTGFPLPYQMSQFGPQPNLVQTPWNFFRSSNPYGLNGTITPVFYPQFGAPNNWNPYFSPGYQPPYPGNTNNGGSEDLQPPKDKDGKLIIEIIDVSPEYQRQLLGWPSKSGDATSNDTAQPKWTVEFQNKNSTKQTVTLQNYSRPIVKHKQYVTSFKRTFVLDSSKPANFTPINIHLYNGVQITTLPPPTTTENENVDPVDEWYENQV